jgi:hypothetical protein
MTEKKLIEAINRLGGVIELPSCIVDFANLQITTKSEALDALNIMRHVNDLKNSDTEYTIDDLNIIFDALIAVIKTGLT